MAIKHRHSVLPKVLTKDVEISPAPVTSDITTMMAVNNPSAPRKYSTDGLRAIKVLRVVSVIT